MKLEDIVNEWSSDAKMDDLNLDTEGARISNLHAKYVSILSKERSVLRGLNIAKSQLTRNLRNYYLGLMTPEELTEFGRQQFQERVLKNELPMFIDTDKSMIDLEAKISLAEEKVDVLLEIMKSINSRNYQLKSIIDWKRLMLGN